MNRFWKFALRPGEVLSCDQCTHDSKGEPAIVYFEESINSDSDFIVHCEGCYELQRSDETQEVEA